MSFKPPRPPTSILQLHIYLVHYIYISSVYSPFSDRVRLPLHNVPSPGVLMKNIGAGILRPDALPGESTTWVGCNTQNRLNIIFWPELNSCTNLCVQFLHKTVTLIYAIKPPFSRLLRHTWVKAVMLF